MQRTQTILCSLLLLGATSGCGLEQFIDENVRFFDIEPRMYEVDPEDGTATTLPAYSSLRSLGTTAMVAGELVSLVGIDEKSKFNSDVQVFDPASNSWRAGAPWPQPRAAAGLVLGEEYCFSPGIAGIDKSETWVMAMNCYDPQSNAWRDLPALPPGDYKDVGWFADPADGTLYAPVEQEGGVPLIYSLAQDATAWQSASGRSCRSYTATFINDRAYLPDCIGGEGADEAAIVEFEPATTTWTRIDAPSSIKRRGMYQATLGSIMVFLENKDGGVTLYDVANNAWAKLEEPDFANANITDQSSAVVDGIMYTVVASRNIDGTLGGEGVFEVWAFDINAQSFEKIKDNTAAAWQEMHLHAHNGRLLAPGAILEPVLSIGQ